MRAGGQVFAKLDAQASAAKCQSREEATCSDPHLIVRGLAICSSHGSCARGAAPMAVIWASLIADSRSSVQPLHKTWRSCEATGCVTHACEPSWSFQSGPVEAATPKEDEPELRLTETLRFAEVGTASSRFCSPLISFFLRVFLKDDLTAFFRGQNPPWLSTVVCSVLNPGGRMRLRAGSRIPRAFASVLFTSHRQDLTKAAEEGNLDPLVGRVPGNWHSGSFRPVVPGSAAPWPEVPTADRLSIPCNTQPQILKPSRARRRPCENLLSWKSLRP